jgi:hemin uptake protein HemP
MEGRPPTPSPTAPPGPPVLDSSELFGGQTEVLILHRGEQYRLRLTRQDKLILTK